MPDHPSMPEPSILVLLDDMDRASMTTGVALDALTALAQLLECQPRGEDLGSRRIAPLLRCIGATARQGWPLA